GRESEVPAALGEFRLARRLVAPLLVAAQREQARLELPVVVDTVAAAVPIEEEQAEIVTPPVDLQQRPGPCAGGEQHRVRLPGRTPFARQPHTPDPARLTLLRIPSRTVGALDRALFRRAAPRVVDR